MDSVENCSSFKWHSQAMLGNYGQAVLGTEITGHLVYQFTFFSVFVANTRTGKYKRVFDSTSSISHAVLIDDYILIF